MTRLHDITQWPKLGPDGTEYPLIGTIDVTPKIGRVLDVAGRQFRVGILNHRDGYAGVRPLTKKLDTSPEAREFEPNIICPYCGNIDSASFERSDEDTTECGECGGTIHYRRIVTVEYTTEPVKPPKPIRAHWVKDT